MTTFADKIIGPHEPYPDEKYLSQLPEALPNVEIVDIGQVEYYKTDHHWTSRGLRIKPTAPICAP